VSRRIFALLFPRLPLAEASVGHVTNGVHAPTWESDSADRLWTGVCGKDRWRGDLTDLENRFQALPDSALWSLRCQARSRLVDRVRARPRRQIAVRGASTETLTDQAEIPVPSGGQYV